MGFCSKRYFFLSVCLLQMFSVIQRQVFDFLGFLWIPILVNFFQIIFIILGFFGAYQYRPKYIISYLIWHLFWLAWNIFLICLYLNVGSLDHKSNIVLKLDNKSESWWGSEGPGCKKIPVHDEPWQADVENCLVNYVHVEIFQAGLQCVFSLISTMIGMCLSRAFMEEDDTSSRKSASRKNNAKRMSLYSIEFNSQLEHRHNDDDDSDENEINGDNDHFAQPVSPKPMTPRRVKRRSVMTRGTTARHSTGGSSSRRHSTARSSTRSSTRKMTHQNPVTRLLEQQQKSQQQQQQQQQQQAYDSPGSLSPIEPLPNYYNTVSMSKNNLMAHQQHWQNNGHSNPTYQQSSSQSLNETDDFDELYNNRPASVRSSYSNFHGTRTLSYTTPPKPHHHSHHQHSHATPQVPQKRSSNVNRNSMRSMAFLNSGPPAYNSSSQGQISADSETTI